MLLTTCMPSCPFRGRSTSIQRWSRDSRHHIPTWDAGNIVCPIRREQQHHAFFFAFLCYLHVILATCNQHPNIASSHAMSTAHRSISPNINACANLNAPQQSKPRESPRIPKRDGWHVGSVTVTLDCIKTEGMRQTTWVGRAGEQRVAQNAADHQVSPGLLGHQLQAKVHRQEHQGDLESNKKLATGGMESAQKCGSLVGGVRRSKRGRLFGQSPRFQRYPTFNQHCYTA